MNKVYVLPPGEDWIVDRFVKEWYEDNSDISVRNPQEADVIWLLADWCWKNLPTALLRSKKVITTVHHIVPEKFGPNERRDFQVRDSFTDTYHVYNQQTLEFIRNITDKRIEFIPYWANQKIWRAAGVPETKRSIREKYGLPIDCYVIGSFQRDTEGAGIESGIYLPKLEKGPDLLVDYVKYLSEKMSKKVHVLLSGWRRQYVIQELKKISIPYTYVERPDQRAINELYQAIDLYPITARCEGGPQALIECGLLGVQTVSRNVGIASQVLPSRAINDDLKLTDPAVPDVNSMLIPTGYEAYRKLISIQ